MNAGTMGLFISSSQIREEMLAARRNALAVYDGSLGCIPPPSFEEEWEAASRFPRGILLYTPPRPTRPTFECAYCRSRHYGHACPNCGATAKL